MKRLPMVPRPDRRKKFAEIGFTFSEIDGQVYWDESAAYAFSLAEIEDGIEAPTGELYGLCMELVDKVVRSEEMLTRLAIPRHAFDLIASSWLDRQRDLYGRFDLVYDGKGPAKLLEFNADTPTSLFEAAVVQWFWLKDMVQSGRLPDSADQFNSIHERLIAAFERIAVGHVHFAGMTDSEEDEATLAYLADCAGQAGLTVSLLSMVQIGLSAGTHFVDGEDQPIETLFKLYPWEWLLADDFGRSPGMVHSRFIEPPWKAILSNKGILPLLWQMAPDHPNLLPAFFEDDDKRFELGHRFAVKPLYSREGANVMLVEGDDVRAWTSGSYGQEGYVRQALCPVPSFDGMRPVIGSWIVGGEPAGIGIREDIGPVTGNNARFIPHLILD